MRHTGHAETRHGSSCSPRWPAPASVAAQGAPRQSLDIYYIDTEGGQSTLFVSPTGESLLVDTGNAGERDLDRIVEAIKAAGLTRIDHLWTTHYHVDHVGAMEELAKRVPVGRFYDHGPMAADDRATPPTFMAMYEALSKGRRTTVKPGDKVPMAGLDIVDGVVERRRTSPSNLREAGRAESGVRRHPEEGRERVHRSRQRASAGFLLTFGKFRTVDLGDLTWNGENDLMCPANRIGTVDLYLVSHHGIDRSNSPALVHGLGRAWRS